QYLGYAGSGRMQTFGGLSCSSMSMRPVGLNVPDASAASPLLDGGSDISGAFGTGVPLMVGLLPPQPPLPRHTVLGWVASTLSLLPARPNVGVPQTRNSSLVWIGPCMLSPVTKLISEQPLGRP